MNCKYTNKNKTMAIVSFKLRPILGNKYTNICTKDESVFKCFIIALNMMRWKVYCIKKITINKKQNKW